MLLKVFVQNKTRDEAPWQATAVALPLRRVQVGNWSGKRDSNSRPQPWQGCALPTELFPLWEETHSKSVSSEREARRAQFEDQSR
jgi:hypothetical protein